LKKNSQKRDIQKPKVGSYYKIFMNGPLSRDNVMEIKKINGTIAIYSVLSESRYENCWDYVRFTIDENHPKLSSLEIELL
jgi:hypothetical protein